MAEMVKTSAFSNTGGVAAVEPAPLLWYQSAGTAAAFANDRAEKNTLCDDLDSTSSFQ